MAFKKCGRCALPGLNNETCPVFNRRMRPEEDGCPMFTREVLTCHYCGQPIIPSETAIFTEKEEGTYVTVCDNCRLALGTCKTCDKGRSCAFEQHPSPNKYITQTVRQGNMIVQQQVRNPEICRETCTESCGCFSVEKGCLRQNNCCDNYKSL